jgi:hypothetical protein
MKVWSSVASTPVSRYYHIDCIRSLPKVQRSCTIFVMTPEIARFWKDARLELRQFCGWEPGKRDRKKTLLRDQLAMEFRRSSRTLKAFLNGHQKSLGQEALFGLFARMPALEARYKQATGRRNGPPASPDAGIGSKTEYGLYVQMTLQFDGFDDQPLSLTAHLPAGREGVLTLKIEAVRVA